VSVEGIMPKGKTISGSVTEQSAPQLTRALKLRDLVLFNLVAVLGLRHLGTAAKFGPSSLVVWLIAAIFFFIPQGLAVIELSSRFPREGGIYFWTKKALGEGHGFLCGWCYWINNVLYYPNLLISMAVIATYIVPKGEMDLAKKWSFVLPVTLVSWWLAVVLNIIGTRKGKWLQNAGALGTYLPGVILILIGIYAVWTQPAAQVITPSSLKPDLTRFSSLNLLATLFFAFAGLELSATMGDEIENPRRNLPRSILIAAPLIALAYIAGTFAVLWLVPASEINVASGFLQAITRGFAHLSPALWGVALFAAALYTIGNIGGLGAWLIGPSRVAFVVGLDRYFPPAFGRLHPRWRTPYVAILVQGILATIFLLIFVLGEGTVENVYLALLDTQILIYFIPYLYLFICFLIHRHRAENEERIVKAPGGKLAAYAVGVSGLLFTLLAMIFAMIPPSDNPNPGTFRITVIGGAAGFVLLGGVIYWRAKLARACQTR
jgi:amino acid transporter